MKVIALPTLATPPFELRVSISRGTIRSNPVQSMEDRDVVFLIVTTLVYAVAIWLGTWLLESVFRKLVPEYMASSGHMKTTVPIVAITTGVLMYVMTRPSVVGPYEQWTFENIGGQLIAGVLVAVLKIRGTKQEEDSGSDGPPFSTA